MAQRNLIRTVVLARSLQEFHAWCRDNRRSPRDRTLLYASGPHALHGLPDDAVIVRHGDWWDRLDGRALETALARLEHNREAMAAA